jgi:hypothetical protein
MGARRLTTMRSSARAAWLADARGRVTMQSGEQASSDLYRGHARRDRPSRFHLHRFRWVGEEPFGNGSRYACRCGAVRVGW